MDKLIGGKTALDAKLATFNGLNWKLQKTDQDEQIDGNVWNSERTRRGFFRQSGQGTLPRNGWAEGDQDYLEVEID